MASSPLYHSEHGEEVAGSPLYHREHGEEEGGKHLPAKIILVIIKLKEGRLG